MALVKLAWTSLAKLAKSGRQNALKHEATLCLKNYVYIKIYESGSEMRKIKHRKIKHTTGLMGANRQRINICSYSPGCEVRTSKFKDSRVVPAKMRNAKMLLDAEYAERYMFLNGNHQAANTTQIATSQDVETQVPCERDQTDMVLQTCR